MATRAFVSSHRRYVDELMGFAVGMGLRPEWFQAKSTPHFDLTVEGRKAAVEHGAIELDQRELIAKIRELRKCRLQDAGDDAIRSHGA